MSDPIEPEDAARALSEIDRQREQVIRRRIFPRWYWWAHALLMTAFAAVVQARSGAVVTIGIALYVVGALAIDTPVRRAARAVTPRRGLATTGWSARRTLLGVGAFVAVLLGVALATGLSLRAAGAPTPYPGTIAAAVTGVVFAVGAQTLVRYEATVRVRRAGGRG